MSTNNTRFQKKNRTIFNENLEMKYGNMVRSRLLVHHTLYRTAK